jgi:RNA polymerase sigma-70 factor (ECF subfamily)
MNKTADFKQLVEQHKDRVYSYAVYMLQNWADAEEVTQTVFLRLWENWERIETMKMKAWIMQVAHNSCIDNLRKRKIAATRLLQLEPHELALLPGETGGGGNPAVEHEQREQKSMVLSAMNALPDRTRGMLLLHYFQGMSYESIGELMDATLSSVKVTIHRGKKKLKEILLERSPEVVESL